MPSFQNVLVNGVNYSWVNLNVVIFGVPMTAITKISYGEKQMKELNYGAGQEPISEGYGNKSYEASIEVYSDWVRQLLIASGGSILALPRFDIPVAFGGSRVLAQTDILRQVAFTENIFKAAQGEGKFLIELPLSIAGISYNV